MGKISVVFVTALTCIFLICQISQTESTRDSDETVPEDVSEESDDKSSSSSNDDNGDSKQEPEARVTSLKCNPESCTATVGKKSDGNSVKVKFTFKPTSQKLKALLVSLVNTGQTARIGLRGLNLLPFTNYTVTAKLANNADAATDPSLTKKASFITKPERPSRVSNLTVTHATPSSLHVLWTAPNDNPPKGKLTQYILQWITPGVSTAARSAIVNENVTSFNITGLEPNTVYKITVSAKNANTEGYGQAVSVTNTTKEQGATDPETGTEMSSTKTTIHFSWNESRNSSGKPDYYRVAFSHGNQRVEQNATDTDITLDGLTPGKKYTLEVQECSEAEGCKKTLKRLEEWTRPEEPRVVETTELQTETDTTLTIQLPVLLNPPGIHWVLLKKSSDVDEDVRKEALGMVRKERKKELMKEEKSKQTQGKGRQRRSANPEQNDDSLRIAAKVEVVEGREQQHMVVVGSDWNGGDGLESDTDYVVFIVTETKAGPYSEYLPSEPRVMKTAKHRKEPALLGLIAGLCGAALLFICFFTILAVKLRKKRSAVLILEEESIEGSL